MNILLALQARHATGRGAHLDISMTDNLFPLAWWALGERAATGSGPGNGDRLLTGGTPRYRLYPARDGRVVAVAAIEQRFWDNFCALIGLDPALRDDTRDPAATIAGVARILAGRDGADWAAAFDGVDCCCNLVETLDTALASPHFTARGIGSGRTRLPNGAEVPALPVPLAPVFREDAARVLAAPAPGSEQAGE